MERNREEKCMKNLFKLLLFCSSTWFCDVSQNTFRFSQNTFFLEWKRSEKRPQKQTSCERRCRRKSYARERACFTRSLYLWREIILAKGEILSEKRQLCASHKVFPARWNSYRQPETASHTKSNEQAVHSMLRSFDSQKHLHAALQATWGFLHNPPKRCIRLHLVQVQKSSCVIRRKFILIGAERKYYKRARVMWQRLCWRWVRETIIF